MLLSLFAMNAKKCYHPTKESCKRAQHIILLILNNGRVNVCHLYPTQQPVHIQSSYVKNLPIFFAVFVRVISFKHNILSLFVRSVMYCDTPHTFIDWFLYHWRVFLQYSIAENRRLPSLMWTHSSPLHQLLLSYLSILTSKPEILTRLHWQNITVPHVTCLSSCYLWHSLTYFMCMSFDWISVPKISSIYNFIISPLLLHLLCCSGNYNFKDNFKIIYYMLSSLIHWKS